MKYLPIVSLILSFFVFLNEISYVGKTSLALVIIALAIAVGLNSISILVEEFGSK